MTVSLESIWDDFSGRLDGFIRARVSDSAVAADLRQEVFIKIGKNLEHLRDFSRLEGWIYHIARNVIVDYYRSRRPTTEVAESLPAEPPAHDAELEGLKVVFRRMIDDLPEPYRSAIVLTEFEGLTQQELAAKAGVSLSGAKSRVQRGRALLKQRLEACCQFEFDRRGGIVGCEPRSRQACAECG